MPRRLLVLALVALLAAVSPAWRDRPPASRSPVAGNPADRLAALPIEDFRYDPATHCSAKPTQGMARVRRLAADATPAASSWGTYRCEKWGKHAASLHAEGRALDWHLDVTSRADRARGRAADPAAARARRAGNPQALARRMGVEEIIWDCGYWALGMAALLAVPRLLRQARAPRKRVDPTVAHRDHIHFGLTRAGAAADSFWAAR